MIGYIITVTYNNAGGLDMTARSIFAALDHLNHPHNAPPDDTSPNYKPIEWIIIDGGSDDHTLQIITQIQAQITDNHLSPHLRLTWQSEADNGIYDAMNKGIAQLRDIKHQCKSSSRAASRTSAASYVLFLNAGDCLAPGNEMLRPSPPISDIITQYQPAMICGDAYDSRPDDGAPPYYKPARLAKAGLPAKTWPHSPRPIALYPAQNIHDQLCYGMFTRHQSIYYRIDHVIAQMNYQKHIDIAGDYDFTLNILKKSTGKKSIKTKIIGKKSIGLEKTPTSPTRGQAYVLYLPWALCLFAPGGVSQRQSWHGWRQERHCRRVHFPQHKSGSYHMRIIRNTRRFWHHFFIECRQFITNTLRHISPKLYHALHRCFRFR